MKKYIEPALEMHKLDLPAICLDKGEDNIKVSNTESGGLDGGELDLGL